MYVVESYLESADTTALLMVKVNKTIEKEEGYVIPSGGPFKDDDGKWKQLILVHDDAEA